MHKTPGNADFRMQNPRECRFQNAECRMSGQVAAPAAPGRQTSAEMLSALVPGYPVRSTANLTHSRFKILHSTFRFSRLHGEGGKVLSIGQAGNKFPTKKALSATQGFFLILEWREPRPLFSFCILHSEICILTDLVLAGAWSFRYNTVRELPGFCQKIPSPHVQGCAGPGSCCAHAVQRH